MKKSITSTDVYGKTYEVPIDQLIWRPAAYAIIINDGKILLTKQYKALHLPGGGVKLGKMPEWVPLEKLDQIKVGSTIDWRSIVRKVTT